MGPSTKKPKISNPSNRQPGRPPLMPAPSSAYTSRPYVANVSVVSQLRGPPDRRYLQEIFHQSRAINTVSSISDASVSATDSNGLKISSISSGGGGGGSRGPAATNAAQLRSSNPYYSVNRGNGLQRISNSAGGGGGGSGNSNNISSVVQLGSGPHLLAMDAASAAGVSGVSMAAAGSTGGANSLRPKVNYTVYPS